MAFVIFFYTGFICFHLEEFHLIFTQKAEYIFINSVYSGFYLFIHLIFFFFLPCRRLGVLI